MEYEIWKDIPGYEGFYQASNLGNIKSVERYYVGGCGCRRKVGGIRKPHKMKDGYLHLMLCKNGNKKHFLVHRLIAITFIPNPNNLPEVNHKDENRQHNSVDNLEWCSSSYNSNYGNRNKRVGLGNGKKVIQSDFEGRIISVYKSASEASRQTGINRNSISGCCRGDKNRLSAGGFKWFYSSSDELSIS